MKILILLCRAFSFVYETFVSFIGSKGMRPNVKVYRRRATALEGTEQSGCAAPGATASWAASPPCGYDPSDAAVGGHAPIRWRNATILPR